jgi:hypothetical protein
MIKDEKKLLTGGEDETAPGFCIPYIIQFVYRDTMEAGSSEGKNVSKIYKQISPVTLEDIEKALCLLICLFIYLFLFICFIVNIYRFETSTKTINLTVHSSENIVLT